MKRSLWLASVVIFLWLIGCDDAEEKKAENDDDRSCINGEFLVTAEACGVDGKGELTEFCVDEKWQEHSCNDPGDWPDHNYTSGYITGCSGQIHYQKWEQKEPAVANLVMLNGRTDYVDKYHHLIPLLTRPWDIIMFDHYGQGRSDGPRAHAVDFDTQQVCDFGKILETTTKAEIPTLVTGHSMGGFVAARYEELHPGKVEGLVLSVPMFGIDTSPFNTQGAMNMAEIAIEDGRGEQHYLSNYVRTGCHEWKSTHDCELYEKFKKDYMTVIGFPTFGWLHAALTGMQLAVEDAEKIGIPVLMFQAELDNSVLPEPQNEFCDSLDECNLVFWAGDYHELWAELDRHLVIKQTLEFLDGILQDR